MKLLVIGSDQATLDPTSDSAARQVAYYSGHEAHVFVLAPGAPSKVELAPGVVFERVGSTNKISGLVACIRALLPLTKSQCFDVVASQDALYCGLCAFIVSKCRKIPLVIQLHGDYLDNPRWTNVKFSNRLLNAMGKFIVRRADAVRCVSGRLKKQVVTDFHVPAEKVFVLPICTDLSLFSPNGATHGGGPFVLFVGRLIEEKSPFLFCDVMIPILRDQPGLTAVVAGEGNLKAEMQRRFADAGLAERVRFLGQQTLPQLAAWYRSCVCLLHTAAWEGWGMPMIEAMACGCPVVTTDTGCAGEAIRDGENGIVVPVDDRAGLERGVRSLVGNAELRKTYSAAGIAEAANWSFGARKDDTMQIYETVRRKN